RSRKRSRAFKRRFTIAAARISLCGEKDRTRDARWPSRMELVGIGVSPRERARGSEGRQPWFLRSPAAFVAHYVRRRWLNFATLALVAIGAAGCGVGVQYGMKLLVDAMSAPGGRGDPAIWNALFLFLALIAVESALW